MAKRQAQAHPMPSPAGAPSAIDLAERALAERITAFTAASEALRAEIEAFEAARAQAAGRASEPALRLVVSRETAEMQAMGDALAAPLAEPAEPAELAVGGKPEPEPPEDERPTPEQIAEFFRTHEERAAAEVDVPAPPEPEPKPRNLAREQLYADLCGAAIGLCGAAALINFVLLK